MNAIDDLLVEVLGWTAVTAGPQRKNYFFDLAPQATAAVPMDFGAQSAERIVRFAEGFVRSVDFLGLSKVYSVVAESIESPTLSNGEAWSFVVIGWSLIMQEMRALAVKERIATPDVILASWAHVWVLHLAASVVIGIYADDMEKFGVMPFTDVSELLSDAYAIEEMTNFPTEEFESQFGNLLLCLRECA